MNPAQKRLGWTMVISVVTLIAAAVVTVLHLNATIEHFARPMNPIIKICATIPLMLIVLLAKFYPGKEHDERDLLISNKATIWGITGTFGFMALAGCLLLTQDSQGTVRRVYLLGFVYITAFIWFLFSSIGGLALYYFSDTFTKKHHFQGESQ